jgi:hypothetical protein
MNRAAQFVVSFCMLAAPVQGQQVATVDLTHPSAPTTPTRKQAQTKGCEGLRPRAIGDGFIEPPDQEPRGIGVEMIGISNQAPSVGSVVQGEARVRNSGVHPIQIPWSADPNVISKGQNARDLKTGEAGVDWEEGSFNVLLRGSGLLKNLTQPLFGSKSVARSQITIGPGEWVTVKISFKIELEYPIPERSIKKGQGQLVVEWEQTAISGTIDKNGCILGSAFFRYSHYYEQQNPAIPIKLN